MVSAYFPFTCISGKEDIVNKINRLFGKFFVYQLDKRFVSSSLAQFCDDGMIDIRVHTVDYEGEIEAALDQFLIWHTTENWEKAVSVDFVRSILEKIIDGGEIDSITSIKNEIRSQVNLDVNMKDSIDVDLVRASLLLILAHIRDLQEFRYDKEYIKFKASEKSLKQILEEGPSKKHDQLEEVENGGFTKEGYVFMCSERIKSWSLLALKFEFNPDFFITSSGVVITSLFDMLSSKFKDLRLKILPFSLENTSINSLGLLEIVNKTIFRNETNNFEDFLFGEARSLLQKKKNSSFLICFPGLSPSFFLSAIISKHPEISGFEKRDVGALSTLIALIR